MVYFFSVDMNPVYSYETNISEYTEITQLTFWHTQGLHHKKERHYHQSHFTFHWILHICNKIQKLKDCGQWLKIKQPQQRLWWKKWSKAEYYMLKRWKIWNERKDQSERKKKLYCNKPNTCTVQVHVHLCVLTHLQLFPQS